MPGVQTRKDPGGEKRGTAKQINSGRGEAPIVSGKPVARRYEPGGAKASKNYESHRFTLPAQDGGRGAGRTGRDEGWFRCACQVLLAPNLTRRKETQRGGGGAGILAR